MPHDVGNISGGVIESRDANARIVRRRDERVTRTKTGADNAEIAIALLLEPVEAA